MTAWKINITDEAKKDITSIWKIVSKRDDDFCYKLALKLYNRYGSKVFEDIFNLFQ